MATAAETTIQLSLKQADVLRQGLWNEYVEALEEVHQKVEEYLTFRPWEADKNKIPTIHSVHFPRADLERIEEMLRNFKWDFGVHTPTFTADMEWLREFLYNNLDRAAQSLHESDAKHFDSCLETVNTYKQMLDQVNEKELTGVVMALPEASRRLQATFHAAFDFGLTDEEVWAVVLEVTKQLPEHAPVNEAMDLIAEGLAKMIEEKRGE